MASKSRTNVQEIDAEVGNSLADAMERFLARMVPLNQLKQGSDLSLTPMEGRAMLWLARHDGCLMSEFARGVEVPLSTATRLVDRLTGKGLLERMRSEADRRVVRVVLSELGRRMERQMREHGQTAIGAMLAKLTPEEQAQLIRLLQVMVSD